MLRGIFLMSRPPLLREGGDFATLQVNPLNEAAVRQHVQNAQPAWVLARRGCAFWTGLPTQGKFIRTRKSSLQTSKLQGATGAFVAGARNTEPHSRAILGTSAVDSTA